jgi:hypothetical protein
MNSRITASLIVFIASLAVIASSLAVESDEDSTGLYIGTTEKGYRVYYSVMNGHFWQRIDMQSKIFFLEGVENGEHLLFLKIAEKQGSATSAIIDSLLDDEVEGFRLSEMAEQIDIFYKDSANRQIPVIEAYRYISRRIKGATPRELDNLAANLRKKYNQK